MSKTLKTEHHEFLVLEKERLDVQLKGVLSPDLYSAVVRHSGGFLKINPTVCKKNLERIDKLEPGEVELLKIIDMVLEKIFDRQFMILFRR